MSVDFNKRQQAQGTFNSLWLLSSKIHKVEQCLGPHWLFSTVKERDWESHEGERHLGISRRCMGRGLILWGGGRTWQRQFNNGPGLFINTTKTPQPVPLLILPCNSISLLSCY